ncbi:hypothetical protein EVAR_33308_1 [Eumeta japonica]|uniref:Uncharacterized protein n=1 Tax=Eumeta variegata TaxID=151549 RepID=A0A4C1WHS9_EUMVA|nr:hypothetical protein EVAR_33308_1 [Eumeta japonica]
MLSLRLRTRCALAFNDNIRLTALSAISAIIDVYPLSWCFCLKNQDISCENRTVGNPNAHGPQYAHAPQQFELKSPPEGDITPLMTKSCLESSKIVEVQTDRDTAVHERDGACAPITRTNYGCDLAPHQINKKNMIH